MGWWWSFSSDDKSSNSSVASLTDGQKERIFGVCPQPQPQPQGANPNPNPDEEWTALIKSFEAPSSTPEPSTQTPNPHPPEDKPQPHDRYLPDGSLNIHPDSLYPVAMSCRQAFDQVFYCQSLGGKFNDVYRFGSVQDCSDQWAAFWFCMRNRTIPAKDKQCMVRNFYKERDERRKREKGSSEDIWPLRTKALERAFDKDPGF
ncbi:hypothetical protein K470DRAFT_254609 [Piedraia hortae CBS 480.64]|uniref:Early meiotic induction protein 1 n=1 Tax=Piedraia hortae CBS 480.64 TaxID=1314780 RepID=A0A6A7C8H4_9PEZI|nr:hypothetical protein K470DRAFT_254609 [Piedraia hortae CBS 480.64]